MKYLRLGVNIDHVATIRNARGSDYPNPLRAALLSQAAGADGITAHLREDRRHIVDDDITVLQEKLHIPLNFEMAPTQEMRDIALKCAPHAVCIVPEKRQELTTEGGYNLVGAENWIGRFIKPLQRIGIRISIFIAAQSEQVQAAVKVGIPVVELHTGVYCDAYHEGRYSDSEDELARIRDCAALAYESGLEVHAGHGLSYDTVKPIAMLPQIAELNIGHFLISESIFSGLERTIIKMRILMQEARE